MTIDPWVPHHKPWPSGYCTRIDCKVPRHMYKTPDGRDWIRRYCEKHAKEYDELVKGKGVVLPFEAGGEVRPSSPDLA